ncbi:hypothetical protein KCU67_g8237, partial [Aureobasidium melanogenum]
MATPSPPKPWERGHAASSSALTSSAAIPTSTTAATPSSNTATTAATPALPSRPESLNSVVDRTASNFSSAQPYQSSPYGGYGGGAMTSPYSRFGSGYGGGMYGGGMYGGG